MDNVETKISKTSKKVNESKISINCVDHKWSDVLKLVSSGKKIVFEAEPDRILPDPHLDVLKSLPIETQILWKQTKELAEFYEQYDGEDREWVSDTKVGLTPISFQGRFDIQNKDPGRRYYWADPERIGVMGAKGWRIEKDKKINTVGPQKNGEHRITINGKTQHVLMSVDAETHKRWENEKRERQRTEMFGKNQSDGDGSIMTQEQLERRIDIENS